MLLRRGVIAAGSCVTALALVAATASAAQPVTVDFTAQGTATFNGQTSPAPCNGAPIFATFTDVIPFRWETRFNTTIQNDDTIVDEPGYLVSHDFGTQSAQAVGSGGDGGAACNQAIAMSIQPCPRDVPADVTTGTPPELRDPDRAAHEDGPAGDENVEIQGPLHLGNDDPVANGVTIGCGLGFNDVTMLNASLPAMFTAHIRLPHDLFYDPRTGETRDSWSTAVSMPASSPVDGSSCAAGNNGIAFTYCSKDVGWSGTVTIRPRADDCTEGATEPPSEPCPPAKPVLPFATVHHLRGPRGKADTTAAALDSGVIPVSGSASGPATVTGSLSAPTANKRTGTGARGHATTAGHTVIATRRMVLRKAKRFTLKLRLTRRGRALLRSWHKPRLSTRLVLTVKSRGGHATHATRQIELRSHASSRKRTSR